MTDWIKFITNINNNGIIIIIGNKIDLKDKREVTNEDAEKFCKENKYEYFEVSAKEGTNVDNILYNSIAGLPVFNAINGETLPKENIIQDLLQENLDSFKAQKYENNGNNLNYNTKKNNNIKDINQNYGINKNGLLNVFKGKKRRKCPF